MKMNVRALVGAGSMAVLLAASNGISAFVTAPSTAGREDLASLRQLRGSGQTPRTATIGQPETTAASPAVAVLGSWALAAAAATVAGRSALAMRAAKDDTKSSSTATMVLEEEKKESETKSFDVFDPSTYGNLSMDDVKKYGAAGTLAYVITELIFWVVAIPTECATFYYTAGRWPDFSSDMDKAAVLGFVFAASNIARLCLPLRFGAALAMAPWVDENIMQRFSDKTQKE